MKLGIFFISIVLANLSSDNKLQKRFGFLRFLGIGKSSIGIDEAAKALATNSDSTNSFKYVDAPGRPITRGTSSSQDGQALLMFPRLPDDVLLDEIIPKISFTEAIAGFKGQYELNTLIKHYSKRGDANQVYRYIFRNIDDISPSNLNEIRQQFKAFANTPGALAKIAEIKEISNGLTLSPLLSGADWNFKAHPTVNALIRSGYVEFTDFIFKNQNFLTNYLKSDGVDSIMDTARRGNLEFISSMFMSIPDNSHDNARKLLDIALEGFIDGNQRGKITQLFERLDLNRVSIDGVETQEILSTWLVYARTSRLNDMWNEINNIIRSQNLN
jgi:hypothetical protein